MEADWIYVNLGTLKRESFEKLEDAGYLSNAANDESEEPATILKGAKKAVLVGQGREIRGSPWFEDLIEGSELGRIKRRRGGQSSADGKTIVEWEITEYEGVDEDFTVTGTGKRKLGSLDGGNDVEMRSD